MTTVFPFLGVRDLQLAPYAFKTRAPLRGLDFQAKFVDCVIRTLPTDTFPPAADVAFHGCKIQDMERNVFPQVEHFKSTLVIEYFQTGRVLLEKFQLVYFYTY